VNEPLALIMGRSRNEQTPDGAAQTVGIEFHNSRSRGDTARGGRVVLVEDDLGGE
jgi:hypothetical protein